MNNWNKNAKKEENMNKIKKAGCDSCGDKPMTSPKREDVKAKPEMGNKPEVKTQPDVKKPYVKEEPKK